MKRAMLFVAATAVILVTLCIDPVWPLRVAGLFLGVWMWSA